MTFSELHEARDISAPRIKSLVSFLAKECLVTLWSQDGSNIADQIILDVEGC